MLGVRALAVTAALALCAGPSLGDGLRAADFLTDVGQANEFQILASTMLIKSAQDGAVRAYARQVLADNEKFHDTLQKMSLLLTGRAPKRFGPSHEDVLAALRQASGTDLDRRYVAAQTQFYGDALVVVRRYALDGETDVLRSLAARLMPPLEEALARTRKLAKQQLAQD